MKHIDAFRLSEAFHTKEGAVTFSVIAEEGQTMTVTLRPCLVPELADLIMRALDAADRRKVERRRMN